MAPKVDDAAFVTTEYITKYEFARVLALRMLQLEKLNYSAEPPFVVALTELRDGTSDAVVRRRLPDGTYEDRAVRDLKMSMQTREMCAAHLYHASRRYGDDNIKKT